MDSSAVTRSSFDICLDTGEFWAFCDEEMFDDCRAAFVAGQEALGRLVSRGVFAGRWEVGDEIKFRFVLDAEPVEPNAALVIASQPLIIGIASREWAPEEMRARAKGAMSDSATAPRLIHAAGTAG